CNPGQQFCAHAQHRRVIAHQKTMHIAPPSRLPAWPLLKADVHGNKEAGPLLLNCPIVDRQSILPLDQTKGGLICLALAQLELGFGEGNLPRRLLSKAAVLCWRYWHARGDILL